MSGFWLLGGKGVVRQRQKKCQEGGEGSLNRLYSKLANLVLAIHVFKINITICKKKNIVVIVLLALN